MMKHFHPAGHGLFQDVNGQIYRARGLAECFDEYENDANNMHGLQSDQISTQLNIYGRIWGRLLDRALHYHQEITSCGNTFGRMVFIPPVQFQRLCSFELFW